MSKYISEAFKQFRLLEDVEDFSLTNDGLDNLGSFMGQALDDEDESVDVIDLEAEVQDDLKKSYVGKVICDCNVCHSNIFYNKEDIVIGEDGIANIDDECPYCMSNDGYTIIGEIREWSPEAEEEIENEMAEDEFEEDEVETDEFSDEELADEPIEIEDEEEEIYEESFRNRRRARRLNESRRRRRARRFREGIENVSIDTEDETMTMTTKDDGGIVLETSPRSDMSDGEFYDDFDMGSETEDVDIDFSDDLEMGDEMIAPISDETEEEILDNSEEGESEESEEGFDLSDLDLEEPTGEEGEEEAEVNVDEFDEESFNELGESYLRRCYDNVNGFKTTSVRVNENLLKIEGNISFKSGAKKKTNFIFESKDAKKGKFIFEGYNQQINRGKKAFRLDCSIKNKTIIPVAMKYNYMGKNGLNESVKLSGVVKARKRK